MLKGLKSLFANFIDTSQGRSHCIPWLIGYFILTNMLYLFLSFLREVFAVTYFGIINLNEANIMFISGLIIFFFYAIILDCSLDDASLISEKEKENIRKSSYDIAESSGINKGRVAQAKEDSVKISEAYMNGYLKGKSESLKPEPSSKAYSRGYEDGYNDALLNNGIK